MLRDKMKWLYFTDLLPDEAKQARDEGKRVDLDEIEDILQTRDEAVREAKARAWMEASEAQPPAETVLTREPNELQAIRASLPGDAERRYAVDDAGLVKHIRAAWAETGWSWNTSTIVKCDPESASLLFASGAPITMCGYDVTRQVLVYASDVERLEASGDALNMAMARMIRK